MIVRNLLYSGLFFRKMRIDDTLLDRLIRQGNTMAAIRGSWADATGQYVDGNQWN